MTIELPSGYYLDNFKDLIAHVYDQYFDLLTDDEKAFYRNFYSLCEDAQKLLVRMLGRKGNYFRATKLQYAEINSTTRCAQDLASYGFIEIHTALDIDEILPLYSRAECLSIVQDNGFDSGKAITSLRRRELDAELMAHYEASDKKIILNEPVYSVSMIDIYTHIKLLFFGNLRQNLSDFILRDLGLYQYESYQIDRDTRLFRDRDHILRHLKLSIILEQAEEVLAKSADDISRFYKSIPCEIKDDRSLHRQTQELSIKLARQLERLCEWEKAADIYTKTPGSEARQRLARVYAKQNRIQEALSLCQLLTGHPHNEEEYEFATHFGYRLAKKNRISWTPPRTYVPPKVTLQLEKSDQVELAALASFSHEGQCYYTENTLFCCVFCLHYWDVIFAPKSGAFSHPFQHRPHDFYDPDFLDKRATLYQEANDRIRKTEVFCRHILGKFEEKKDLVFPFSSSALLDRHLIELALDRIPGRDWMAIFIRMWSDLRRHRAGLPDLILFPDSGAYELIEVKGPGDSLQKNQGRWMAFFNMHNIPHKVCYVEWR